MHAFWRENCSFQVICSKHYPMTPSGIAFKPCQAAPMPKIKEMQINQPLLPHLDDYITKTCLFKYIENFTTKKKRKFSDKNSDIFHISAQKIDCVYSLEPPRRGGSNGYPQSMLLSSNKKNNDYSCKSQFCYMNMGLRGSKLYRHVFVMTMPDRLHQTTQ